MSRRALITGAFSNLGSGVAGELLARGWWVETLTNRERPAGNVELASIAAKPLVFGPDHLRRACDGMDVLVTTYWVRFPHRNVTFDTAIENLRMLFEAARDAGVGRIVHISVSNASEDSPLGYYSGKARAEHILAEVGVPHSIVRPTLIVGPHDVLTGNIAWCLRNLPVFGMPRGAGYMLQPVTLHDAAAIVADQAEETGNHTVDAAGPERMTFREYVTLLARAIDVPLRTIPVPPRVAVAALKPLGWALDDTVLTWEELEGLRTNLLVSHRPPLGQQLVSEWLMEHGRDFGTTYVNDTIDRFGRAAAASLSQSQS